MGGKEDERDEDRMDVCFIPIQRSNARLPNNPMPGDLTYDGWR